LQPFGLDGGSVVRFSVNGDDVRLQPKAALTFAMVFDELATNGAKYGAFSKGGRGRIDISWRVEPTPRGPPSRRGFGSRLIEGGLAQELHGEVRLSDEPTGLVCKIVAPVPQGLRHE
jgi:two-component sensor histidine kinase